MRFRGIRLEEVMTSESHDPELEGQALSPELQALLKEAQNS